ncbi:MAG: DUF1015 family protein [Verrucomicrobia bacterium]|nr:DUF1015 family protein [Verrucomicrobiota bacterium]
MAIVRPFAAVRPRPELAGKICELPYDVMSAAEARRMAEGNPLSFLRVSRPEIEFPEGTNPYGAGIYTRGAANFRRLIQQGDLVRDAMPAFYLYRQVMGGHGQVGLVAVASCEEYLKGNVRKHEHTRPDKEDDRVRHIEALEAQTGPAFLVYRANAEVGAVVEVVLAGAPEIDFVAEDGVRHSAWVIRDVAMTAKIESCFARVPMLYIADGHHRTAAAARVSQARAGAGQSGFFLAVLFPDDQVQILPYHRVLRDLNGLTRNEFLSALAQSGELVSGGEGQPGQSGELGVFLGGQWHTLRLNRDRREAGGPADRLDVARLQREVLAPLLGIDDPRTSQRIAFVGGIRGPKELERLVSGGDYACAFAMRSTTISELLEVAESGGIMPPKSTWFEPKLRDGMFSHLLA